jgi:membrane-bound lytic murein transglycosylase D
MLSWLMGVVVGICLLAGCAGGQKAHQITKPPVQPEVVAAVPDDQEESSSLTEELSAKRLEELYAKSGIPGWDPSLEDELQKWEHQVKFDVPIQMNKQVRAYLVYFSTERKEIIRRYLSRSTRYLPMIKEVFQEYGLPEDLAYLAMIESGFNARAYSHAHASGMWQFIKGTGLRYGLAIDSYVDERRDPEKSTRAAAKYLLDLYKQFGSWYLAAASYNCGEGRVQRELDQSKHKNFWELSANMCLPNETKNYVPQMIAATIIAKNPEKFGFKNVPYLPPLKCERVPVPEPTSLAAAAVAVNVPVEEMQALNPGLLRGVTPPDESSFVLNLPANSKETFTKNITLASIEHPAVASRPVRTVKKSVHHHTIGKSRTARHHSTVARKSSRSKSHSYARSSNKARPAVFAQKTKSTPASAAQDASPRVASMFGYAGNNKKKASPQAASSGKGKSTGRVAKTRDRKTGTYLARKGQSASRSSGRAKTAKKPAPSRKDKYSKAKSRPFLMSEAR